MIARVLLVAAVIACAAGCTDTPREHCEKRQDAWERAFPDMDRKQTVDDRKRFIDSCTENLEAATKSERDCRRKCYDANIHDGDDPKAEYMAMTACERICLD